MTSSAPSSYVRVFLAIDGTQLATSGHALACRLQYDDKGTQQVEWFGSYQDSDTFHELHGDHGLQPDQQLIKHEEQTYKFFEMPTAHVSRFKFLKSNPQTTD
jgi:hypothetical protein